MKLKKIGGAFLPYSEEFDDIYLSSFELGQNGETEHVFLQGNRLSERFRKASSFCVGELGFGTGFNFLSTWRLWGQESQPEFRTLEYLSFEKYPLSRGQLADLLPQELGTYRDQFLKKYFIHEPYPSGTDFGIRRLRFDDGVHLILVLGDAREWISRVRARVDAWFLDGFAPAKNPELWSDEVFRGMAQLSHASSTFATFSAASSVRRGLQAVGFQVEKRKGFGKKREMLVGKFQGDSVKAGTPWFRFPSVKKRPRRVAVVGAGIAGIALAHSFAKRGVLVDLFDKNNESMTGASGNEAAITMPVLSAKRDRLSEVYLQAFHLAEQELSSYSSFHASGVLHPLTGKRKEKLESAFKDPYFESSLGKLISDKYFGAAAVYPQAGWVNPKKLAQEVLSRFSDRIRFHHSGSFQQEADVVVLANASGLKDFPQAKTLPLDPIRGQVAVLRSSDLEKKLSQAVSAEGIYIPLGNGRVLLGSTYERDGKPSQELLPRELQDKLEADFGPGLSYELESCRSSVRLSTPDYLPLIGPLAVEKTFMEDFRGLRDGVVRGYSDPRYHSGLYLSAAHGSRGFITAFLASELIAAHLLGEALPVDQQVIEAVHPSRFWVRQLKRGISY